MGSRKAKKQRPAESADPARPLPPANPPKKRKGILLATCAIYALWLAALVTMALLT